MRKVIDPGKERRKINVVEDICYSHVTDLEGNPLDLCMTLMLQNGIGERRLADGRDGKGSTGLQPVMIWINGNGWRRCGRMRMAAEMTYLAEAGYAVAFIDYRDSARGHFPAQVRDVKTAVRFLRAHAGEYRINPDRIGTIGSSAGGHLSAWMAMNTDGFDTEEWQGYSSRIRAAVDLFGPIDLEDCVEENHRHFSEPDYYWHREPETYEGAYLGVTDGMSKEEAMVLGRKASPHYHISEQMAPMLILHGDRDPLVPAYSSEKLYEEICRKGLESRADLYIVKNGGHGTREFFQQETRQVILDFLERHI